MWRQAVLKCVFMDIPLRLVSGLAGRADGELGRMLADLADERHAAGRTIPAGATVPPCWPQLEPTRRRQADADLRPAHPHELTHDRRLRADGRGRGARAGRAGLLARPAADQRRLVHRLLRLAGRLGAVPGQPVRHPAPLRHRAQPQGGQRPALPGSARPAAPLPGQGRGGGGGRGRLRLDDPSGGRGVRGPARAGRRARLAGARAHTAPGQAARHAAHARRGQGVRSRPGPGAWSTT